MQSRSNVATTQNWLADEVGIGLALRQAKHLLRRGIAHPWLALILTLLLSSACIATLVVVKGYYRPRFVLRAVEADQDPQSMPRPKRQLREYVTGGIFTSQLLQDVIRTYGLYPRLMAENPRDALDQFRRDISVDVYQNYFVEDRLPGDPPRSVRLAVSYRSADRALAQSVTRDLGNLIIQREHAIRGMLATNAAQSAKVARERLAHSLEERSRDVLAKQQQVATSLQPNPQLQVELIAAMGSLTALERQVQAVERHSAAVDLGAALEHRGMGLSFQVVEDATLPGDARRRNVALWSFGGAFVLGFPFVVLAIGAFEPKREMV
ncbi:MAG TPA: hypothetical protein VL137_05350 [Polyangiaceae bacterium]|nr:hypothetical protein [Polyangiaceae bacterium]